MSIEDVFVWIDNRRLVGQLSVELGDVAHAFHFEEGGIRFASSNVPGEQLGQLLMSRGLVTESQLSEAFSVMADTGVFIGKVLLTSGIVSEAVLKEVLEIKVREAIWQVLSWEGGNFEFVPGTRDGAEYEIRVSLGATLDLGKLQVRRWRAIRELIPSGQLQFWMKDSDAALDPKHSSQISKQVTRLIDCVERGLTVNQMVLEHNGRRFQVMTHLADLVERGAITQNRASALRPPSQDETSAEAEIAARAQAQSGDKVGALELTLRALDVEPECQPLQELRKELQRSLFAELSRELLATYRVPKIVVDRDEIQNMKLSDHERYLVGRIDGHWDLLSLMRLSPIHEVDALLTFKRLQERGIIEL